MITYKELEKLIHYNPETGIVTWKIRPIEFFKNKRAQSSWNARFSTKIAGYKYVSCRGTMYFRVSIFNKTYSIHRIAWLYMTGDWPNDQIDHIDGNGLNNKWENIRDVSSLENNQNQRLGAANTSGIVGVSWHKGLGKWAARIGHNHKLVRLGCFDDISDAASARKRAERDLGFHPNHGRIKNNG